MSDTIFYAIPWILMGCFGAALIGVPLYYKVMKHVPTKYQAYHAALDKWFWRKGPSTDRMPLLINGEIFYQSGNAGLIQNAAGEVCDRETGQPSVRPAPPKPFPVSA